jgi:hypothetical protein
MFYMHICTKRGREGGRERERERERETRRERDLWGEESTWYNFLCAEVDVIQAYTHRHRNRDRERERGRERESHWEKRTRGTL